jgi:hypothetical protein
VSAAAAAEQPQEQQQNHRSRYGANQADRVEGGVTAGVAEEGVGQQAPDEGARDPQE